MLCCYGRWTEDVFKIIVKLYIVTVYFLNDQMHSENRIIS